MIRLLNPTDNEMVLKYLKKEKAMNLFILGDLENFGYDSDFQKLWGEFDGNGALKGILLKYYNNYVFYSKDNFDLEGFLNIIKCNKNFRVLSGKKELMVKFAEHLKDITMKETYFAELTTLRNLETAPISKIQILKSDYQDLQGILDLRNRIDEFSDVKGDIESMKKTLESKSGRNYFIKFDAKVVACVSTTAENSASAMVVGVCTDSEYRRRGFATQCMIKLCEDVLKEGKSLCLFYNNPKAAGIYKKLGFTDIGHWVMLINKSK